MLSIFDVHFKVDRGKRSNPLMVFNKMFFKFGFKYTGESKRPSTLVLACQSAANQVYMVRTGILDLGAHSATKGPFIKYIMIPFIFRTFQKFGWHRL